MAMIAVEDESLPAFGTGRAEVAPPERPTLGETVTAAFNLENPVVSLVNRLRQEAFPAVDGHNPLDTIKGTKFDQYHRENFLDSQSPDEDRAIMARIETEEGERKALEASGIPGVVAQFGAGMLDPTLAIPGTAIIRGARGGYSIARSALLAGASAGAQAAFTEGVLQETQETRTAAESAFAIGTATLLGGLLGAGAVSMLSRVERQALETALDADRAALDAHAGRSPMPASAGAAATDTRALELETALGLEKVTPGSPLRRVFNAESVEGRRIMADLAETPYTFKENEAGGATSAAPSVETMSRMEVQGRQAQISDEMTRLYADYYFGQPDAAFPRMRAQFDQITGRGAGKMSYQEFSKEVSAAAMFGDTHAVPQVAAAANFVRNMALEPWAQRAEGAIEGFKRLEPKDGESYFPHVWNKEKIRAERPAFTNRLVDLYKADQETKAAAKQRLEFSAAQLKSWDGEVAKFESRIEALDQRQELLGAKMDERAMELRRTEGRGDTLTERASTIAEEVREIRTFIAEARTELRDPALRERLDAMEQEAAALERSDRPVTEANLRQVEEEELKSILTGETRMAAEMVVGRRKPPKPPSLVSWILKQGGIKGDSPGALEALQSVDRSTWQGKRLIKEDGKTIEELAERLAEDFPAARGDPSGARGGVPEIGDMLRLIDESTRGNQPWFMRSNDPAFNAAEQAAALDEMFARAGVQPKNIRDVAQILRGDGGNVTIADLDRIAAEMEAAGESIPLGLRKAGLDEQIAVQRETIAGIRSRLADAERAKASRDERLSRAEVAGNEVLIAERANRGRLGVLQDRMTRAEARRELLVDAAEMASRMRDEVRGKVETELGAWDGKSAQEAKSAIKAREKYAKESGRDPDAPRLESADTSIDRVVRRIIDSERDLSVDELRARAQQTVDRILGSPDGRLPYDEHTGGPRMGPASDNLRGSEMHRQLDVSNEWARDWIEDNIEEVAARHLRTLVPDVLIAERFGDVDMSAAMRKVEQDYADRADKLGPGQSSAKLGKERDAVIRDIALVRDRLRGTYGWSADSSTQKMARVASALKQYNSLTSMGMVAVSSLPDAAGAIFRFGLGNTFRDGWTPFFANLRQSSEEWTKFKTQMRALGIGVDTLTNARMHALDDLNDVYKPQSRFERTLKGVSDKFFLANLLAPQTDAFKTIAAHVAVSEVLRASQAVAAGKATSKQIADLAANSVDRQMATRIAQQFETGGETTNGVRLPNTKDWTDRAAADALNGAVAREVNIAVVTPGQEKPAFFSHPVLSLLTQFKSFTQSANERILIANMQRRDARVLQGVIFSMGLGMMSYKLNSFLGGQPTSERPQDWVKEGVSRSGLLGWLEEGNALASKATRGGVDIHRLYGADKPLSRFVSQDAADMLLGPTWAKIKSIPKMTGSATSGEWGESDTKALRRLMAFNNLFWLRGALNQVEAGANDAFGIETKPRP